MCQAAATLAREERVAEQPKGGDGSPHQEIAFDFVKSEFFRVIHVDGVIGGPTPRGLLHMAFYSQRPPLPKRIVQKITPTGQLGESVAEKMVVQDAIIREMDVDVIMSIDVAKQVHQWLGERLNEIEVRQRAR
jgi:hypothetical protein